MGRLWILGASDPEMKAIELLLAGAGERRAYAVDGDGSRVHPGVAYRAVAHSRGEIRPGTAVYLVECDVPVAGHVARIDHHRPGDPGYGRPAAEFLPASSIGQVVAELARLDLWPYSETPREWEATDVRAEWCGRPHEDAHGSGGWWIVGADSRGTRHRLPYARVPNEILCAAAADHCLAAAYRGECPGVDPDALMRWRVAVRAAHQGRTVKDVRADIERARAVLREARHIPLRDPGALVADLRGQHIPELPEAAAREGIAFLAAVPARDGRLKVVLQCATPEHIGAWPEWAAREGLVDLYGGDPERGFAGGYVTGVRGAVGVT